MFQIVCRPRVLTDISEADAPLDLATFDLIKERLLCPICTDVFKNPYNVRQCGHKFCQTCIEDFNRLYKKECPSCPAPAVSTSVGADHAAPDSRER